MKVSIILFKGDGPNQQNQYPIKLVVSHKNYRKRKTISHSNELNWNAANSIPLITHPDYDNLYPEVLTYKARAFNPKLKDCIDVEVAMNFLLDIKKQLRIDFYKFANERISYMKAQNREGNAAAYTAAIEQLKLYAPTLFVDQINASFLEGFKEAQKMKLIELKNGTYKRLKNTTIRTYLYEIRAIYNSCVKRYNIINSRPFIGLFADLHVSKRRVKNVFLDKQKIKLLEQAENLPEGQQRAVDLSLLQFYFGGLDFVDVCYLKWEQLIDARVYLKRAKLGEKAEEFDLKVFDCAQKIIDKYATKKTEYVFPWHKERIKYITFRRTHNRSLQAVMKKLNIETLPKNEPITTKAIRHSFATIAKFLFIDVDIIRELMGHERGDIDTVYKDKYPQEVRDEAHFIIIS